MALNSYAHLTVNGAALSGDVSSDQLAGVNVGSDHIELQRVAFGADTARDVASGQARGRRQYEPLRLIKRIDRSTPLLYRALAQNERVSGEVLLFDMNPGDGSVRQFFTIGIENATVSGIASVSPDTRDPAVSTWMPYEEVTLAFAGITLTYEDGGIAFEDKIGQIR